MFTFSQQELYQRPSTFQRGHSTIQLPGRIRKIQKKKGEKVLMRMQPTVILTKYENPIILLYDSWLQFKRKSKKSYGRYMGAKKP